MSNQANYYWPKWLHDLMGERERQIASASNVRVTNYDSEYDHDRLPPGMYHVISHEGRFTFDATQRKIVS